MSLTDQGIQRRMAGININKMQEEWNTLHGYLTENWRGEVKRSWEDFCKEYRKGDVSISELSKLMNNLFDTEPYRMIVETKEVKDLMELANAFREGFEDKWKLVLRNATEGLAEKEIIGDRE